VPVAAYTVSLAVIASKGSFPGIRQCRTHEGRLQGKPDYPGLSDATIAILGVGTIGSMVAEGLSRYPYKLIGYDPYLSEARAAELGIEKVSLEEAFERGFIITNHIANLESTKGLLKGELFARMPRNATFINTGRGATIEEEAMLDVLAARPDLTALLDVTWPEPPAPESRVFTLPNVFLTPHIAGSQGKEVLMQADYAIADFERYRAGEPLQFSVTEKMLETMA
jgi:phosphoglycerate dehydrogenase-like enzyme